MVGHTDSGLITAKRESYGRQWRQSEVAENGNTGGKSWAVTYGNVCAPTDAELSLSWLNNTVSDRLRRRRELGAPPRLQCQCKISDRLLNWFKSIHNSKRQGELRK